MALRVHVTVSRHNQFHEDTFVGNPSFTTVFESTESSNSADPLIPADWSGSPDIALPDRSFNRLVEVITNTPIRVAIAQDGESPSDATSYPMPVPAGGFSVRYIIAPAGVSGLYMKGLV